MFLLGFKYAIPFTSAAVYVRVCTHLCASVRALDHVHTPTYTRARATSGMHASAVKTWRRDTFKVQTLTTERMRTRASFCTRVSAQYGAIRVIRQCTPPDTQLPFSLPLGILGEVRVSSGSVLGGRPLSSRPSTSSSRLIWSADGQQNANLAPVRA